MRRTSREFDNSDSKSFMPWSKEEDDYLRSCYASAEAIARILNKTPEEVKRRRKLLDLKERKISPTDEQRQFKKDKRSVFSRLKDVLRFFTFSLRFNRKKLYHEFYTHVNKKTIEKIKELRKAGLSYNQISRLLGISPATVSLHSNPTLAKLRLLRRLERNKERRKTDPSFKEREKIYRKRQREKSKEILRSYPFRAGDTIQCQKCGRIWTLKSDQLPIYCKKCNLRFRAYPPKKLILGKFRVLDGLEYRKA